MTNIIQKDSPILRKKAKEVVISDIASKRIKDVIKSMKIALKSQEDGVAIAAPQIGISLRIFLVSAKVHNIINEKSNAKDSSKGKHNDEIYINPQILKKSKEKKVVEEGCLSVRWLYGKVKRSKQVTIKALNEKGKPILKGASSLMAQIFQHEIDHLNGILFIDNATDIEEMLPENNS